MLDRTEDLMDAAPAAHERRVAYVRSMRSEEVAFLCADAPLLAAGYQVFVLHDADGMPIVVADSREAVLADAAQNQIETVSLH